MPQQLRRSQSRHSAVYCTPPVRLDPAQSAQLGAARKRATRQAELWEATRQNGPKDLAGSQQQMQGEREITPYRKLRQEVKLRMKATMAGMIFQQWHPRLSGPENS